MSTYGRLSTYEYNELLVQNIHRPYSMRAFRGAVVVLVASNVPLKTRRLPVRRRHDGN